MKTNTNIEELAVFIVDYEFQDRNARFKSRIELARYYATLIDQYVHQKTIEARMQMKLNVFQQFKHEMALQSLSATPPNGTRFRTPLEVLTIILENEMPLAELQASLNTEGES